MSQLYINQDYQDPPTNLATGLGPNHFNADEEQWKYFLTKIRSSASNRLTFIGAIYILIGVLSIGLEFVLLFGTHICLFGCFANGLFLIIVGILTLILCRQEVYVLTSLFVLLIFQLVVTIFTFGLYGYFLYDFFDELIHCFKSTGSFTCDHAGQILFILIGDIVHLFLTFCLIIVNLIIIRNVRRAPITPVATNHIVYAPQTH